MRHGTGETAAARAVAVGSDEVPASRLAPVPDLPAAGSEGHDGLWAPQSGRHELVLVDAGGEELDRVRFEVRGARQ